MVDAQRTSLGFEREREKERERERESIYWCMRRHGKTGWSGRVGSIRFAGQTSHRSNGSFLNGSIGLQVGSG